MLVRDPILGQGEYHTCAVPPGGRLLAVGMTDGVGLWDLPSGNPLAFFPERGMVIECAGSHALLSNGPAGLLRWPIQNDAATGVVRIGPPRNLPLPGNDCWIAARRDGRVVASAQRWGGLVWHQDRPGKPIPLSPHEDTRYIAVSPDGRWVATGSHWGTKVKIWDARKGGEPTHELPLEAGYWVRFSPDGLWLGTSGGGYRLWAVDTWQEGPPIGGRAFAFSPEGKLLAVEMGHGVIRLVNPESGREYARLEDPNQDRAHNLCFSSDGAQVVSCTSGNWSVHVWDLRILRGHLAEMGLNWDWPPYPPAEESAERKPLQTQVDLGDILTRNLALAKNNEAWQLAAYPEAQPRDPRRAVELAKEAVVLAPKEGNCWNTLGVAHYRAGNWQESIAALEKSMQLLSGHFEAFNTLFLSMAHWQRNDKEQARKFYDQAVGCLEKNKEGLKKDKLHEEELHRFRAEAPALLGI